MYVCMWCNFFFALFCVLCENNPRLGGRSPCWGTVRKIIFVPKCSIVSSPVRNFWHAVSWQRWIYFKKWHEWEICVPIEVARNWFPQTEFINLWFALGTLIDTFLSIGLERENIYFLFFILLASYDKLYSFYNSYTFIHNLTSDGHQGNLLLLTS